MSRLSELKEKYGEYHAPSGVLDPKPLTCPCGCGSRYAYQSFRIRSGADFGFSPREGYEQRREYYDQSIGRTTR